MSVDNKTPRSDELLAKDLAPIAPPLESLVSVELTSPQLKEEFLAPHDFRIGKVKSVPEEMETCCCKPRPVPPVELSGFVDFPEHKYEPLKPKKVVAVVNPFSGNNAAAAVLAKIKPIFEKAGVLMEIKQTIRAGHATDIGLDTDFSLYDAILVIGGDGTYNEFLNGFMIRPRKDSDKPLPPIGLIPAGTGNSLAVSMGIIDPVDAARAVVDGYLRKIDLGKISVSDGKVYYMCNLMGWGLGVDANITAENLRCCGPCRYDIGGIWNILKGLNRRAKVNIDGEILDDDFSCILVQNNQHGGSFLRFAPYAKIDDGCLDVVFARNVGRGSNIDMFNELKRGGSHVYCDWVLYRRFKKMQLETEPANMLVNIDGENCGTTPLTVEVISSAVLMYAPKP